MRAIAVARFLLDQSGSFSGIALFLIAGTMIATDFPPPKYVCVSNTNNFPISGECCGADLVECVGLPRSRLFFLPREFEECAVHSCSFNGTDLGWYNTQPHAVLVVMTPIIFLLCGGPTLWLVLAAIRHVIMMPVLDNQVRPWVLPELHISPTTPDDECSICCDSIGDYVALTCGHRFHQACVTTWFRKQIDVLCVQATCPLCRAKA